MMNESKSKLGKPKTGRILISKNYEKRKRQKENYREKIKTILGIFHKLLKTLPDIILLSKKASGKINKF